MASSVEDTRESNSIPISDSLEEEGPAEPPPSYEEAQKMIPGGAPAPQQYPPQQVPYQAPSEGYAGNPPYTQAGQPAPYPTQPGVGQQPYAYGQPAMPPQGAYPPAQGAYPPAQGAYPPAQGAYPPGSYVHPTVGYSPAGGVIVQGQNQVVIPPATRVVSSPDAQRRKQVILGVVVAITVLIIFIIIFSTVF